MKTLPFPFPVRSCKRPAMLRQGFSLVEVLIVIALIGIMGGLALGQYISYHSKIMRKVTNQRNAQEIVSMGVNATMGGAPFVVEGNKRATVQNLVAGTVGEMGLMKGKVFRLTGLSDEMLSSALEYVKFDSGLLLYEPAGGQ